MFVSFFYRHQNETENCKECFQYVMTTKQCACFKNERQPAVNTRYDKSCKRLTQRHVTSIVLRHKLVRGLILDQRPRQFIVNLGMRLLLSLVLGRLLRVVQVQHDIKFRFLFMQHSLTSFATNTLLFVSAILGILCTRDKRVRHRISV